jgi:hypothetical protein
MVTKDTLRALEGKNVGIEYRNYFGLQKLANGYLRLENKFIYLYDLGKSGAGYNFAFHYNSRRDLNKIIRIEELPDQVYEEIILENGLRSQVLHIPEFV